MMIRPFLATFALAGLVLVGCEKKTDPAPGATPAPSGGAPATMPADATGHATDGDVENGLEGSVALNVSNNVRTVKVTGMTCDGCAMGIQTTLAKLDWVKNAQVSYADGNAVVELADPAKADEVVAAINGAGFGAELEPAENG